MRCSACQREIPVGEGAQFCPYCGAKVGASTTGLAVGPGDTHSTTGLAVHPMPGPTPVPEPRPTPPGPSPAPPLWKLDRGQVEQWVQGGLPLDEVLGIREDTSWNEIRDRWQKLQDTAQKWERHPTDGELQRLGQRVSNKIAELQDRFADETDARAFLWGQRLEWLAQKYRRQLEEWTRDGVLQVEEWMSLVRSAQQEGYGLEDLTLLVQEWAEDHPNVLVGVQVGDRLLMTPREVCDLWDQEGPRGIAQVDPERMTRWIQECVGDEEKAQGWRQGRWHLVLWSWGSRVCWVGEYRLESLKAWGEGVYRGNLETETLQQMDVVADWLETVHNQKEGADRLRQAQSQSTQERRRVLRTVLEEVFWRIEDRPDPEVAYGGTRRWLEEDPEFEEGLYWHVIHCAQTGRDKEGISCLRTLLDRTAGKGDTFFDYQVRLRRNLPNLSPQFWSQAEPVLENYKSRLGILPFKFREGQAQDLLGLAQLCDRFPEEAADYLTHERFEQWLGTRGEAPLAEMCNKIVNTYRNHPEQALEMFVRALYRSLGREQEGLPRLRAELTKGKEWESLPVGAVARAQIRLSREGRGYVWGTVTVSGSTQDLSWTSAFNNIPATIDLQLDTARYAPGTYTAVLVIQPEGLPPIQVPLLWEVAPVEVVLTPPRLDFGRVPGGLRTAEVRLECRTPGGRIVVDRVEPAPPVPGLQVEPHAREGTWVVTVRWDTNALEAGRLYQTNVRISTNVGTWNVPVSIRRGIPWTAIWARAVGFGALIGGFLWLVRRIWLPEIWSWNLNLEAGETLGRLTAMGVLILSSLSMIIILALKKSSANREDFNNRLNKLAKEAAVAPVVAGVIALLMPNFWGLLAIMGIVVALGLWIYKSIPKGREE